MADVFYKCSSCGWIAEVNQKPETCEKCGGKMEPVAQQPGHVGCTGKFNQ